MPGRAFIRPFLPFAGSDVFPWYTHIFMPSIAMMNKFQQQHVLNVVESLTSILSDDNYLDVTMSVDGREFKSNRLLLCASSDYFRSLFQFYSARAETSRVATKRHYNLSSEYLTINGLGFIINFINSLGQDCRALSRNEYETIYTGASFLQVPALQAMLSSLLEHTLDSTSVLDTIRIAATFNDQRLYKKCMIVLLDQFHALDVHSENFQNLSEDMIWEIFSGDQANVPRESFMVKALLSWLCGDVQSRFEFFRKNFTRLLRLSLVEANELLAIERDPHFKEAHDALALLHCHLIGSGPNNCTENYLVLDSCMNRTRSGTSFRIYAIGGVDEGRSQSSNGVPSTPEFFSYDSTMSCIYHHPSPTEPSRVYHTVASSLGWLYVIGGESEDGQLMSQCSRYNLLTQRWQSMSPLDAPRSHHNAVCIENFVYTFGGYRWNWVTGYSPAADSILWYDSITDLWHSSPHHLPFAAVDMGVVMLTNRRLVMLAGGQHEHGTEMVTSDVVVLYDPAEEPDCCFIHLPKLPLPLTAPALVYAEQSDLVLVCGGRTDQPHLMQTTQNSLLSGQIFAYDFESRCWSFITTLDYPRYYGAAFISRSTLYVLGGITSDEAVESAENDWTTLNPNRSNLLQTPYRTCHFVESWHIQRKPDTDDDVESSRFRLRRQQCPLAQHTDHRVVVTRCLAGYCFAPYFPPSALT